jgi:hypothetical protein
LKARPDRHPSGSWDPLMLHNIRRGVGQYPWIPASAGMTNGLCGVRHPPKVSLGKPHSIMVERVAVLVMIAADEADKGRLVIGRQAAWVALQPAIKL